MLGKEELGHGLGHPGLKLKKVTSEGLLSSYSSPLFQLGEGSGRGPGFLSGLSSPLGSLEAGQKETKGRVGKLAARCGPEETK